MKLGLLSNPQFFTALNKLLSTELPIKTAYKLKKEALKLEEENKRYEEMRMSIINELSQKGKDGKPLANENGSVKFLEGKEIVAIQKINELLDIDIDCEGVSIDDLGDISLSATDLIILGDLIKD